MMEFTREIIVPVPAGQVFAVLADASLLMQLRSDWGSLKLEAASPDFPAPGSGFTLRPSADGQDSFIVTVMELLPDQRLVLSSGGGAFSRLTWSLYPRDAGCLLRLEAALTSDSDEGLRLEEEQARSWLENIKNFAALGRSGWQRVIRWILERHVLRLRAEQRRIILMLLALQMVTCLTFIAAVLGLGLASLILSWFKA